MPTLPKLPYTDNGTKTSVTAFTGITKTGDGALYDGLNMCSDYYPNIATRKGFAKVALLKGTASYTPGFDVKAAAMLADGSGIVYIGEQKIARHDLATCTVTETTLDKSITVEPHSVVSFVRTWSVSLPNVKDVVDGQQVRITPLRYDYRFYITLIMSAKLAFIYSVKETIALDGTVTDTKTEDYTVEMGEAVVKQSTGFYTDYSLSTWFGTTGASYAAPDPVTAPDPNVNRANPPTYLDPAKESVVSAAQISEDELFDLLAPGLYYKIRKQTGTSANSSDVTGTGLALEVFKNGELTLKYPAELGKSFNGAVFWDNDPNNPTGFKANTKPTLETTPTQAYFYAPEAGVYTISWGDAPDGIRGAFISGNRMWVYDEHSIYASWLGQYELFTVDGTDNGGWSVTLPGTKLITGGIEYGGRPVFFTEDSIITVYGGYPSAFSTRMDDAWGVEYGSEQSLQLCAGSLYYLSKAGVMRYSGNVPVCISNDLTRYQLNNGRAGADGRHYYLYAENLARDGDSVTTEAYIYVWDVIRQSWHKWQYTGACGWNDSISAGGTLISNPIFTYVKYEPEDVSHVLFVNGTDKGVYAVPSYDRQKLIPGAIIRDGYFGYNDSRRWDIRLGRFYMNTTNMKILKGVHLRARLLSQPRCKPDGGQDRAARFYVRICYDDANAALDEYPIDVKTGFEEIHTENQPQSDAVAGEIYAERNIYIPIQNRRYESFWLDISGRERWEISGLAFEYEASGRT